MNARHAFLVPHLVGLVLLTIGTSVALADSHRQSKHPGPAPSHRPQVHATHSAHGGPARPAVYSIRPGHPVRRAEVIYRPPHPIHPVHRHPPVVVVRPLVVYPPVVYDTMCIRIVNPLELGVTVPYLLDGQQIFLQPGEIQTLYGRCIITFDRGNGHGWRRLVLTGGTYVFGVASDGGWILRRS
jgi:hypothetical protein